MSEKSSAENAAVHQSAHNNEESVNEATKMENNVQLPQESIDICSQAMNCEYESQQAESANNIDDVANKEVPMEITNQAEQLPSENNSRQQQLASGCSDENDSPQQQLASGYGDVVTSVSSDQSPTICNSPSPKPSESPTSEVPERESTDISADPSPRPGNIIKSHVF